MGAERMREGEREGEIPKKELEDSWVAEGAHLFPPTSALPLPSVSV